MSVKSVLQLILLSMIIIIIGGIYFLYFYSNQNVKETNFLKDSGLISEENNSEKIQNDQVILGDKKIQNLESDNNLKNENSDKESNTKKNLNKTKNLTKQIIYTTSNKKGDIFKIFAENGQTNFENSNILELKKVRGSISSKDREEINIISERGKYNYENYNSKFYKNVKIKFDNKVITCDNVDLSITDNIAVAYNNVIINDKDSTMIADSVVLDLTTKDIIINSKDKVNIKVD